MNQVAMEIILSETRNKFLDFGPPLSFKQVCTAYTVQRLSLWEHTTEDKFELIAVRAAYLNKARAQGTLYDVSDEELYQLDKKRGHGVHSERKWMSIWVTVLEPNPNNIWSHQKLRPVERMVKTNAWVYVGNNDYWVDVIEDGSRDHFNFNGTNISKPITHHLLDTYPHDDPRLNGRFCFLPPSYDMGRVTNLTPRMKKHVKRRNHQEMRKLWFARLRNFLGEKHHLTDV